MIRVFTLLAFVATALLSMTATAEARFSLADYIAASQKIVPMNKKCDTNDDCPGFANSCFAGLCTSSDSNQCNSNSDCPGFANSCFAGHCTSDDTNQCDSNADCHGFANSCFAGHCTNP